MQLENHSAAAAVVVSVVARPSDFVHLFSISLTGDGKSQIKKTVFSALACRQSSTVFSHRWHQVGLPSDKLDSDCFICIPRCLGNACAQWTEFKINQTRVHHVKELLKCVLAVCVCSVWTRRDQADHSCPSHSHSGPTMESSKVRGTLCTQIYCTCLYISEMFETLAAFKCVCGARRSCF